MSLRIRSPAASSELEAEALPDTADGWASRLAKLIPAEALGLYGATASVVPPTSGDFSASSRAATLYAVAIICLVFSAAIRLRATASDGKPQVGSVIISVISFVVWLVALGAPASPVQLPAGFAFIGPLLAILWATIASYFYRGNSA